MWDKVKKWIVAAAAVLLAGALGVGYAMRQRSVRATAELAKGQEQDALVRGREEAPRARLRLIKQELDKKERPAGKRTPAQVLEEQRRRGQVDE